MAIEYLNNEAEEALEIGDKKFYRYYTLEYAELCLSGHNIWFSNPTKWDDPFEKLFLEAKYELGGATHDFPYKNKIFCLCITFEDNNLASWKAYADPKNITVRFEINTKELLNLLAGQTDYDVYIGKVMYKGVKKIEGKKGPIDFQLDNLFNSNIPVKEKLRLLFIKRWAFRYEKEFRIIIIPQTIDKKKDGVKIFFDKKMIQRIFTKTVITPFASEAEFKKIKKDLSALGLNPKSIKKSGLRDPLAPKLYQLNY